MIVFGYAKDYKYNKDGALMIRVRIPSIHGPFRQENYGGRSVRNYTLDENLPYYHSVLLPHNPADGEVVVLESTQTNNYEFVVIGMTGGSYHSGSEI